MARKSAIGQRRDATDYVAAAGRHARRGEIADATTPMCNRPGYNSASISAVMAELKTDRVSLCYCVP